MDLTDLENGLLEPLRKLLLRKIARNLGILGMSLEESLEQAAGIFRFSVILRS